MERVNRVEFNVEQQCFHNANHNRDAPDTFGWFTVFEYCSDTEYWLFRAILHSRYGDRPSAKYTRQQILECARQSEATLIYLSEQGFSINNMNI